MKFAVFTVGMPEYSPEEAVRTLKECGYDGAITIEREISGEEQLADIKRAIKILEALI